MAEKVFIDKSVLVTDKKPIASRKHNALDLKAYIEQVAPQAGPLSYAQYEIDTSNNSSNPLVLDSAISEIIPGNIIAPGMHAVLPDPTVHGDTVIVTWSYASSADFEITLLPPTGYTIMGVSSAVIPTGAIITFKVIESTKDFVIISNWGKQLLRAGSNSAPSLVFENYPDGGLYQNSAGTVIGSTIPLIDNSSTTVTGSLTLSDADRVTLVQADASSNNVTITLDVSLKGYNPIIVQTAGTNQVNIVPHTVNGVVILGVTTQITLSAVGSSVRLYSIGGNTYAIESVYGSVTIT